MYQPNRWWDNAPSNVQPNYPGPQPSQNAGQGLSRFSDQSPNAISMIPGKMIAQPGDITPNEVPMDGSLSVFPQSDFTCIYAKAWTDKGIVTVRYIPESQVIEQNSRQSQVVIPDDFKQEIFSRLDAIEAALPKRRSTKVTKEETPNE